MPRSSFPTAPAKKAIVVDDSRMMRVILRRALELRGFEVSEAVDGQDALRRLAQMPVPELALIDWKMPEINGIELILSLRADSRYSRMAIIMVTSETEPEQVERALAAGANEYVMKPLTSEILGQKLLLIEQESAP
jgi:two-component system, chemotaxis family, chemotaxis protein CheY